MKLKKKATLKLYIRIEFTLKTILLGLPFSIGDLGLEVNKAFLISLPSSTVA